MSSDEDALAKLEAKIAENRALLLEKENLQKRLEQQDERLLTIDKCHQEKMEFIIKQNQAMRDENRRMKDLEDKLVKAVEERDALIKNRDTRLGRISELEAKLTQKDIDN